MLFNVLITGTPSTTKRGWLSLLREEAPLITMLTDDPVPPVELMTTPDIFPASELITFSWATLIKSSPSTLPTENPSDFSSRVIPSAVTTTSRKTSTLSTSSTLIILRPPTITSWVSYPIKENISTASAPGTSIV